MTTEQINRTAKSLAKTRKFLKRELTYLPHLQDLAIIEHYEKHIIKLEGMLCNAYPGGIKR